MASVMYLSSKLLFSLKVLKKTFPPLIVFLLADLINYMYVKNSDNSLAIDYRR